MASCDVQTLLDSAACFDCLSPGLKESVKLQLLCEILSAGGGGGGVGTVTNVSVTTANGVSGIVTDPTGAAQIALTLGAITPISAAFTGTAGAGFIKLLTQSADPAAPASGFTLFANSTGRFSWRNAADGFTRSFEVTATANRVFTLPNADFTFAGLSIAQTFSAANTFSANGAASTPALYISGAPYTAGDATTAKALFLIETAGAVTNNWSSAGTMLGVNAASGYAGNLLYVQANGASRLLLTAAGNLTVNNGNVTAGGAVQAGTSVQISTDAILTRRAAANWNLGAADAAAPVAQTLSVQSVVAGTLDTAGANFTITGSRGTGAGAGGKLLFQVAPAGTGGGATVQNTLTTAVQVQADGSFRFGTSSAYAFPFSGGTYTAVSLASRGLAFYSQATTAGDVGFAFSGDNLTATSGILKSILIPRTFAPTSGTGVYTHIEVNPTINQTGGANGITRGLYINPTLTAAADFRAIEVSSGVVQIASSLTTASVTGTDQNGTTMTLSPGVGTGAGRAGDRVTKTGNTTTTGTTAHTLSTRCYESAKFVDLTPATATTLFTMTVGTNNYTGITIDCTVFAAHGGELQVLHSVVNVGAVNKAGTLTMGLAQVDGAATNTSGTLTPVTYTAVDNGSGVLAIKVNATTSLSGTPTTLRAKWQARFNSNDAATVTAS